MSTPAEERAIFEAAIVDNPRDHAARLIYADWLDEHDEPELSDLHRAWTEEKQSEAEKFLDEYAEECGMNRVELLAIARKSLEGGYYFHHIPFEIPERVYTDAEAFWRHFSVITNQVFPEGKNDTFISCVC